MKYIKTYEKYTSNLKNFVLITKFDDKHETLFIYEIIEILTGKTFQKDIEHFVKYKILYKLKKNMNKPLKMIGINTIEYSQLKKNIISQSDNLSDCLNKMNIYFDAKKYNL